MFSVIWICWIKIYYLKPCYIVKFRGSISLLDSLVGSTLGLCFSEYGSIPPAVGFFIYLHDQSQFGSGFASTSLISYIHTLIIHYFTSDTHDIYFCILVVWLFHCLLIIFLIHFFNLCHPVCTF